MQLCLGSSTDRLCASILLVSGHSPTYSKNPTSTMAPKHLLVLLPLQSLLLLAPAGQANATVPQPATATNGAFNASRTDYLSPLITGDKIASSPFLQSVLNH